MCIRDRLYKDKGGAMRFECVASFPLMIHRAQQEQTYAAHVIRIVLDIELLVGVTSAPFQIRLTGGGENLVRVFLSLRCV